MIKIQEVLVTEGKYDKIKLSQIFDTLILTTDGFEVYKSKQKIALIKRLAKEKGVILLTDSDAAGFRIRNYIKQCLGDVPVKNAYIPEIQGKERRKTKPGAEGLLGVEGIPDDVLIQAVMAQASSSASIQEPVTKADFYELGLTGAADSKEKRTALAKSLRLPAKLSANALLDIINTLYTREEFFEQYNANFKPS